MTAEELEKKHKIGEALSVLDVRSRAEYTSGHIRGAHHAPLANVLTSVQAVVKNKEELLVLVCEHGPRAQLARIFLKLNGYKHLELLDGHMSQWRSSGRAVKKGVKS